MDRLTYFEKLYLQELSRRTSFSTQLPAPTAAIGAISASLCYLLAHFKYGGTNYIFSTVVEDFFLFFSLISALTTMASAILLWNVARGLGYEYMPDPSEQHGFLRKLEEWNKQENVKDARDEAEEEFKAHLTAKFRKCASLNWRSNNYHSRLVYLGITTVGLSLVLLVVALVCYYIDVRFDSVLPTPA